MEMELAAITARLAVLEAGLLAALRMHPVPEAAIDEIRDAADEAMSALGDSSDDAQPEHMAAMGAISAQVSVLVGALTC